jgi:beta-lactamase class A
VFACWIAAALITTVLGEEKSDAIRHDTGSDLLWKKLETRVDEISHRLDGVIGVAVLDLTDGHILLRNADRVFPAASSIKIAILLELYRQDQKAHEGAAGNARLDDVYTFDPKDLVEGSRIMAGLTAGVTRVTNRDLALAKWLCRRTATSRCEAKLLSLAAYCPRLSRQNEHLRLRITATDKDPRRQ